MRVANKSFENVAKVRDLVLPLIHREGIQEELQQVSRDCRYRAFVFPFAVQNAT